MNVMTQVLYSVVIKGPKTFQIRLDTITGESLRYEVHSRGLSLGSLSSVILRMATGSAVALHPVCAFLASASAMA